MAHLICPSRFPYLDVPHSGSSIPFQNQISINHSSGARIRNSKLSFSIQCSENTVQARRTCKNCKGSFDPSLNHDRACQFHTAHFGGETKRKFESVHTGGTMDTPGSGKVLQYWHCCGSEDPFDPGCTSGPHYSYDD
uniref:Uncharacterized protein n=1 Tax=Kalanchoe fedtschenkoi TaxID=63787 RepID=A0A7N0UKS5_KALFE